MYVSEFTRCVWYVDGRSKAMEGMEESGGGLRDHSTNRGRLGSGGLAQKGGSRYFHLIWDTMGFIHVSILDRQ